MNYTIKNKIVSLGAGSTVKNDAGLDCYRVKGRVFTFTKKKFIKDLSNNTLYSVRNKFFHIWLPKVFIYDSNNNKLLTIKKKKLFSFKKDFLIISDTLNLRVDGDYIGRNYTIYENDKEIGYVRRNFNLVKDSFLLQTIDDSKAPFMIAIVIALDNFFDKLANNSRR